VTETILKLMTPVEILEKRDNFEKAWPILPERFPTFDHLLEWREKIRDLVLLPVKSDEMRAYYKTLDKNELAREVWEQLGDERFMFAGNKFPYMVPENTQQYILWIKDPMETREEVAEHIKHIVQAMNFNLDDVILFERPVGITTQLVRGTFPLIRHVHLWTRA
jgi:hypothetical protein